MSNNSNSNSNNALTPGTNRIEEALAAITRNPNIESNPSNNDPAIENIEDAMNFIKQNQPETQTN